MTNGEVGAAHYRRRDLYTGAVIARLAPELARRAVGGLSGDDEVLRPLVALLDEMKVGERRPLVSALSREQIFERERLAARNGMPVRRSLTAYWRLDMRNQPEHMPALVERLNRLPGVEHAYIDVAMAPPAVAPNDDPHFAAHQGYLRAAPLGIDAMWAWAQPGGTGDSVRLADLEAGWNVNHEDFASKTLTLIAGVNRVPAAATTAPFNWPNFGDPAFADWNHGTMTLGVLAADDNAAGMVGVAPGLKTIRLGSVWDGATPGHLTDAIAAAMLNLAAGDIVLLEVQTARGSVTGWPDNHPAEIKDDVFDAIQLAAGSGLVIIAAAGNGSADLDAYVSPQGTDAGKNVLRRLDAAGNPGPDFRDSYATMVGAATAQTPHTWAGPSNYGSRVDCFGWVERVGTCGTGPLAVIGGTIPYDPNPNKWYTTEYGHTSGASAIVAGAAVLVQSMRVAAGMPPLTSVQMRALLGDAALNTTAQPSNPPRPIGVMPNLRAISIGQGLAPDVYLRDAVGDTGAVPSAGAVSLSPDIVVRSVKITRAAAHAQFGEGSGNENRDDLVEAVTVGKDSSIYVRMRNRGAVPAVGVVAHVWWSDLAVNVTPNTWTYIGAAAPVDVPVGDVLTVAGPVDWPAGQLPPTGHYCLIAMLDSARDPMTTALAQLDWSGFEDLIRMRNNVTFRNIDVVPATAKGWVGPEFFIGGAFGEARRFEFEVMQTLPPGVEIALEVPVELAKLLHARGSVEIRRGADDRTAMLLLASRKATAFKDVPIAPNARYRARFLVATTATCDERHSLAIRQLSNGLEIGRVTWRFAPPRSAA